MNHKLYAHIIRQRKREATYVQKRTVSMPETCWPSEKTAVWSFRSKLDIVVIVTIFLPARVANFES